MAARKIDLTYVLTDKMIANSQTKLSTYAKFHGFLDQMHMT